MSVKDGGMMLVTALTPDLRWQSGAAELAMSVRGVKSSPQVCSLILLWLATVHAAFCMLLRWSL